MVLLHTQISSYGFKSSSVSRSLNKNDGSYFSFNNNASCDSFSISYKKISFGSSIIKPHEFNAFVNKSKGIVCELAQRYPKDDILRRNILAALRLPEQEKWKLASLIGPEELKTLLVKFDKTPEVYVPESKEFGVDLHIHTNYSDGNSTPEYLLNYLTRYADRRVELDIIKSERFSGNIPFVFAITDHNTIGGSKNVINTIVQAPYKYRNVGFVVGGAELMAKYTSPILKEPIPSSSCELLLYGANPFDEKIYNFVDEFEQRSLAHRERHGRICDIFHKLRMKPSNTILSWMAPDNDIEIIEIIEKLHSLKFEGILGISHPLILFANSEDLVKNKFKKQCSSEGRNYLYEYIINVLNWFHKETEKKGITGTVETYHKGFRYSPRAVEYENLIARNSRQTKLFHTGGTDSHGYYKVENDIDL